MGVNITMSAISKPISISEKVTTFRINEIKNFYRSFVQDANKINYFCELLVMPLYDYFLEVHRVLQIENIKLDEVFM